MQVSVFAVSGLGFGMMSGLFAMVNILADITGPGTLGLYGDYKSFLVVTGMLDYFVLMGYVGEMPWWPIQSPNKGRK